MCLPRDVGKHVVLPLTEVITAFVISFPIVCFAMTVGSYVIVSVVMIIAADSLELS